MELWQLRQKQSLPLEVKIEMSKRRIIEWYDHFDGKVYVSFSGGKDSTVLLDLVRQIYPDVPAVFVDTGLEYPEIREFVKAIDNVVWLRPKMPFNEVIKKYGYPVISKEQSFRIRKLRNMNLTEKYRADQMKRLGKWKVLLDAKFETSEQCCNAMKKQPFKAFEKAHDLRPFIGMIASESMNRERHYLNTGCNAFDLNRPQSQPLGFWIEEDIWNYLKTYNIPYSRIYDMGEKRTGCMFCMFGVHLESTPNRFQRMAVTHPKQYKYCMENLGIGEILDYIKVPYRVYPHGLIGEMKKGDRGQKYEQLKLI